MYSSKELSIELYKLSSWEEETFDWWGENKTYLAPRYSVGYLLRKLYEVKVNLRIEHNHGDMRWYAYYAGKFGNIIDVGITDNADTPEDAACKLAIELFKQGVLHA